MTEFQELRRQARQYETLGDLDRAVEAYEEAIERSEAKDVGPTDPLLFVYLAEIHHRRGDEAQALENYRRAADRFLAQGLLPNAISVWRKVLHIFPDNLDFYRVVLDLYSEIGLTEEAREPLLELLDGLEHEWGTEGVVSRLKEELDEHAHGGLALLLARFLEDRGRTEEARELVETILEKRAREGRPVDRLREWLRTGRLQDALQDPAGAAPDGAGTPSAAGERTRGDHTGGDAARDGRMSPPAIQADVLRRAVGLPGESDEAMAPTDSPRVVEQFESGVGEDAAAERRERIEELTETLAGLAPDEEEDRYSQTAMALAELLEGEGSPHAARELYRRLLARHPRNHGARQALAELDLRELEEIRRRGKLAGARHASPRDSDPAESAIRRRLGMWLWEATESSVRAAPWLQAATQAYQAVAPGRRPPAEAFELLGRYLLLRSEPERAVKAFRQALELYGEEASAHPETLYHLAAACEAAGLDEKARAHRRELAASDDSFNRLRKLDDVP